MEDDIMLKRIFDLAELCQHFIDHVIKKIPLNSFSPSALKFGDIRNDITLYELAFNQRDYAFYEHTLQLLK